MSKLEYRKLSMEEIEEGLAAGPGWARSDEGIAREFKFRNYEEGLAFAVHVGYLANRLNHHPDIYIGYGKVRVSVSTHAVKGLSPYDFELARLIDATESPF